MDDKTITRTEGATADPDPRSPMLAYVVPAQVDGQYVKETVHLWRVIASNKFMILLTMVVCALIALVYAFTKTPVYRADVLLSPVSESGNSDIQTMPAQLQSLVSLTGVLPERRDNLKNEAIATLKSRAFITRFISDENLLPVLFEEHWDSAEGSWKTEPGHSPPSDWHGYEFFEDRVFHVSQDRATGLVTVTIEWKDRNLAALWANKLVERINSHMRQRTIEEAEKSTAYLNQELGKTTIVELQKAIYALIEEQVGRIMMANVREEYVFKVIDPAVTPDPDDFYSPKRELIIGLGIVWGIMLGVFLAFVREMLRNAKSSAHP